MNAADIVRPDEWHDFFLMVGGGAAALTGLVFLAMSLNLGVIFRDATHQARAIGTLTGLTAAFLACAFALLGRQGHVAIGIEMLVLALVAGWVYVRGYLQAARSGGAQLLPSRPRTIGGTLCYLTEAVGGVVLMLGQIAGLYVTTVAMVVNFYFLVSGAWLLLVGVHLGSKKAAS